MWYKIKRWFQTEFPEMLKFFLVLCSSTIGFLATYLVIWMKSGLPANGDAIIIVLVLALLSEFGLMQWITKR